MARILVIDDDELVRSTVRQMLESAGHQVSTAVDGDDGLRQFRQAPADLVLCDVFMPNKTGIATLKELQQDTADVPVIIMSGGIPGSRRIGETAIGEYFQLAKLLGAAETLHKPFRADALVAMVQRCLKGGLPSPPE